MEGVTLLPPDKEHTDPHKLTQEFQFRRILFLDIGIFLHNKPEDVLKVYPSFL